MTEVVKTEDTLHGKPRIKGTRVGVKTIYELYTVKEMDKEEVSNQYNSITQEDVEAAIDYVEKTGESKASAIA
jgi:uncharacterized protein (DUF433 family)